MDNKTNEKFATERANAMYGAICDEYKRVHGVGEIPDSSQAMIEDICTMEDIKQRLLEEIARKPIEHVRNGRQEYHKPNGAISEVNRLISSQRRHMAEMKLTPASRKAQTDDQREDDFTAF